MGALLHEKEYGPTMIVVNHVTKSYGKVRGLEEVSLELNTGETLVILGPSGSGKTTLLRLIAGLEMPDEGEIYIDDSLASRPGWTLVPHKRNIGFVFQVSALWPHMTVAQNILFGLDTLPKNTVRDRVVELLDRTGLTGLQERYPDELSGGEARRVAIARSLAPHPRYLLLDEPLINLDPELKQEMLSLIKETTLQTEASLIYVTHDVNEAWHVSSGRVLTLKSGRLE